MGREQGGRLSLSQVSKYNNRQAVLTVTGLPLKACEERELGRGREACMVSSINRQTTAKEYRSIKGLAKIL